MGTSSSKTNKAETTETNQTTQEPQPMNGKSNNQNHQTSTTPYSEFDLRNEAIKSQAVKDAFSDARMYLECYDNHFEALKNTGITNLLQSKIQEQNQQLQKRESQDFLLMTPEEIMQRMNATRQLLASPSTSNCKYLPHNLG